MKFELKNIILLSILLALSINEIHSQTTIQPRQLDYSFGGVLYTDEKSVFGGIHTSGFSMGYRKGNIKKYYLTSFYQFEISSLKHPKEYFQNLRTQSILHNITSSGGFVYGKQNSFFTLRGGVGSKRFFLRKRSAKV